MYQVPLQDSGQKNVPYTEESSVSEEMFYPNLQRFVWRRHAGAHLDGHQHGGRKPTKTSVAEYWYKSVNLYLEELILRNIKVIHFLTHQMFRQQNSSKAMDPFRNRTDKKRFRTHIFVFFSTCKRSPFFRYRSVTFFMSPWCSTSVVQRTSHACQKKKLESILRHSEASIPLIVRVSAVCKIKPSACSWNLPEAPFDCEVRYKGC